MRETLRRILLLAIAAGFAPLALADWSVENDDSVLSFITVKADHVAEVHTFDALSGQVSDNGTAEIEIELISVNTLIPIRNERMQAMLFETNLFPTANISAQVDIEKYAGMAIGASDSLALDFDLSLRGQSQRYTAEVMIARLEDGLMVATSKPVVVSADSFDLATGVEALREVAGLPIISKAVPVSFQLKFTNN